MGFDYVDAASIASELKCAVCAHPWTDAKQTPCEHVFCAKCVEGYTTCPECKLPLRNEPLQKPIKMLTNMVDKLQVYCSLKEAKSCSWMGSRCDHDNHVQTAHPETLPAKDILYVSVDDVVAELKCSICLMPWESPLQTPCEHIFCTHCIEPFSNSNCPDCRQPLKAHQLKKPSRALLSMVDRIPVYCSFKHATNCVWSGDRGNLADHLHAEHGVAKPTPASTTIITAATSSSAEVEELSLQTVNEFPSIAEGGSRAIVSMAHIAAPKLDLTNRKRKPTRIVACIDLSSSMRGEKLELVKRTLLFTISQLADDDEFGIVGFSHAATTHQPIGPMNALRKNQATIAISRMEAKGGTNIFAGLLECFAALSGNYSRPNSANVLKRCSTSFKTVSTATFVKDDRPTTIWMFTDGKDGFACTASAVQNAMRSNRYDGTIYTFGFGPTHNADLLRDIADVSQGTYYYIPDESSVVGSFANCLGGLFSIVAQNITLTVKLAPGVEVSKVLSQVAVRPAANSRDLIIEMKDLCSEEQRDILIEFRLQRVRAATTVPIVEWCLSYTNTSTSQQVYKSVHSSVDIRADRDPTPSPIDSVVEQRQRIAVVEVLEQAKVMGRSDANAARAHINMHRRVMAAARPSASPMASHFLDDLHEAEEMFNGEGKEREQRLTSMAMGHAKQRCNNVSSRNVYQSSHRAKMQEMAHK